MSDIILMLAVLAFSVMVGVLPLIVFAIFQMRLTDREIAERGILPPERGSGR
jgi:hypothetical protein